MEKYIDIHTHNPKEDVLSIQSIILKKDTEPPSLTHDSTFYSVGLHPWYLDFNHFENAEKKIVESLSWPKVIAYGECGLDRLKGPPLCDQIRWLKMQLNLFKQTTLSVCYIHCVKAWNELIPLLKQEGLRNKFFILHDYNSSLDEFNQLLQFENIYFSLGSNFLKPQSKIHRFIDQIPQERLFFETDDSNNSIQEVYQLYLGKWNNELTLSQLISITNQNFYTLWPHFQSLKSSS